MCTLPSGAACSAEVQSQLSQANTNQRLLFKQVTVPESLQQLGLDTTQVRQHIRLPGTLLLQVSQVPLAYKVALSTNWYGVTQTGKVVPQPAGESDVATFTIASASLSAQLTQTTPPELSPLLHTALLNFVQVADQQQLPLTAVLLEDDGRVRITLSSQIQGLVSLYDPESLIRLAQVLTSPEVSLDPDQTYEVDARFVHPVLRKRG